ncbi:MAG: acetyl-CoA C-acetyltransferase [Oligoflexia bacterium]|nr:acetyl-CoA C-acetyltransferase [Oligoflexia bacterium]
MRKVAIIGSRRTPFVRSFGAYKGLSNQELMSTVLKDLVKAYKLNGEILGDVAIGAVMKNASDWNLAREAVQDSGLSPLTPAYDVQRACGTSLETTWQLALKIASGAQEIAIAGGTDTNSDIQGTLTKRLSRLLMELSKAPNLSSRIRILFQLRPSYFIPQFPAVVEPRTGLSMGEHCELMVKQWHITQREQDELAVTSHLSASKAYKEGFYSDLLVQIGDVQKDAFVRGDTSLEKLRQLKPAFDKSGQGSLTAGNSTPLTDGAAAVLLASEDEAKRRGWKPLAYFVDAQSAAVDYAHGDGLLMAPTLAVAALLKRNNLKLQDFDFYEIHEAFAGQVLATLKAWQDPDYCRRVLGQEAPLGKIDLSRLNVDGGSLALGHPFAATGARIVGSLAKRLSIKGSGRGLISICTAGGMGVAAILEK